MQNRARPQLLPIKIFVFPSPAPFIDVTRQAHKIRLSFRRFFFPLVHSPSAAIMGGVWGDVTVWKWSLHFFAKHLLGSRTCSRTSILMTLTKTVVAYMIANARFSPWTQAKMCFGHAGNFTDVSADGHLLRGRDFHHFLLRLAYETAEDVRFGKGIFLSRKSVLGRKIGTLLNSLKNVSDCENNRSEWEQCCICLGSQIVNQTISRTNSSLIETSFFKSKQIHHLPRYSSSFSYI